MGMQKNPSRWPGAVTIVMVLVALSTGAQAQDPEERMFDRIIAIVGEKPILESDLEVELLIREQETGARRPSDPTQLDGIRRALLDNLIREELFAQAAERDTSIRVTNEQVQQEVDEVVRRLRNAAASELAFERELRRAGFYNIDAYRRWRTEQIRRKLLYQAYLRWAQQNGQLRTIPPTEDEIQQAYEQFRGTFGQRPPLVSVRQIVIHAKPDQASLDGAFAVADSLWGLLNEAQEEGYRVDSLFADLAREFSQDPMTAPLGGDLGWQRRGVLVKEFDDHAFAVRPGSFSGPFLTEFGYHIVYVNRRQPGEVLVRHILIQPVVSNEQKQLALAQAEDAALRWRAGASFDSLLTEYGSTSEDRVAEGIPVDSLPPSYQAAITGVPVDSIPPSFELVEQGLPKFVVLKVVDRKDGGEPTIDDMRDTLIQFLGRTAAEERLVEQLRREAYVVITL